MGNEKKSAQLGMPYGTANARLRKAILFSLLCKLGENICCRCGEGIDSSDAMTIDHIEPWFGVSNDLYWDVDNIAFAHPDCNNRAGRTVRSNGICHRCGVEPVRVNGDGWAKECRKCNTEQKAIWRARTGAT